MKQRLCHWLQQSALAVEARPWYRRLATMVAAIGAATLAQLKLPSGSPEIGLYLLFHPAVIWATWYGGFRTGILGALLALAAACLLLPGQGANRWPPHWSLFAFPVVSTALITLTTLLRLAMVELKRASDKALQDKEAIEHLYDSISDAFFSLDKQWRFVYVNRKAMELKPPEEEQLIGHNLWESCGHKISADAKDRLRAAMRDRLPVAFEHHIPGSECWQEVHAYPSENGLSLFLTDVSERKRLEQRLEAANEQLRRYTFELEERVTDRTERLMDMAAELKAFSYSVSHDLRSPLRSMQAYAQTILDQSGQQLEPTARFYLERIERSARRLDQLIQDVLTFEQLAGGRFTIEKVDLDELIRDIIHQYPTLARRQNCIRIDAPLLPVKGNAACLTQCLANLLDNAIRSLSPEQQARIRLSTCRIGKNVRLEVEDGGMGMRPKPVDSGLQALPFHILIGDAGISLAVAKKAIERMGGHFIIEDAEGKAKRFILELEAA